MQPELFFDQYEKIIDGLAQQNYAIVEGLILPEVLLGLRKEMHRLQAEDRLKRAGIGQQGNFALERSIRSDKIHWIKNASEHPFESAFMSQVGGFSTYLNRTCYTGIYDWEFHYACFETGCFYKKHYDTFRFDEKRKFSMVTYLNKNWTEKDGGMLVLYLKGYEVRILPEWGKTVIFKSELIEHEVIPAHRNRYSITGWLK